MKYFNNLCIPVFILCLIAYTIECKYRRICYCSNWSQYRPGIGKFFPNDIDADLCTHIIYAFAKLENNQIKTLEWDDEKLYGMLSELKVKNPKLKTLIAIGGWNARSTQFTTMVKTVENRQEFANSTINFLRKYDFDGLDLDWEYPTLRGGKPKDKINFGLLLKELRKAYENEAKSSGRDRLLLSVAVSAGKDTIDVAYDIPTMIGSVDFINLMTYDLHGSWETTTGHNSPLYPRKDENGTARHLNMQWASEYWVKRGAPKSSLNIGLATYGRTFTLRSPKNYSIGAEASGPGLAGKYTREAGFLSYYEVCLLQVSGEGHTYFDKEQEVPYYVSGRQWVGFDDVQSLTIKTHWLMNEGFGGVMVWDLPLDDFNKSCPLSHSKYPLVQTIKNILTLDEIKNELSLQNYDILVH